MDGKKKPETQAQEEARGCYLTAIEWALQGTVRGYNAVRNGCPSYVVRVVTTDGAVYSGTSTSGYGEALVEAYRRFLGGCQKRDR